MRPILSEDKILTVQGKPYRCDCGSNVFKELLPTHPSYSTKFRMFRCNGCLYLYSSDLWGAPTFEIKE
jgi:hypothetical protein